MIKHLFIGAIVVLSISACGGSSNKSTTINIPDSAFIAVGETAKEEMATNESAAVSIAIYHNGNIVYADAFGNTKANGGVPVTKDTLFQLGSTTKMLTSLATLQLVDEGVITLDDTLTIALPDLQYPTEQANEWQGISVHHLMTHQGGLSDDYKEMADDAPLSNMLTQYANANPLMVEPGRFHNYTNPHYTYLGVILEYYRQQDYRDIMKQSVFEPLGMKRTTMQTSAVLDDGDYALGVYHDENGNATGYTDLFEVEDLPVMTPAGLYTWSTPTEILKMAEFLLNGDSEILSNDLREEILKPQVSVDFAGLPEQYGYGIYVDDGFIHEDKWYPIKLWQHGGDTIGYTSKFWILPEQNIAISILSSGRLDDYTNTLVEAIKSITTLPTPVDIPYGEVNINSFDNHVGTYDAGSYTLEIDNNDGKLEINIPELNSQNIAYEKVLEPIGENTFIAVVGPEVFQLTFFPEVEGGESVYIRDRSFVGIRIGR